MKLRGVSEEGLFSFSFKEEETVSEEYRKYIYIGPVNVFDRCVSNRWSGETMAPSMSKARSNLVYQAKKQLHLIANTTVTLPGKIVLK